MAFHLEFRVVGLLGFRARTPLHRKAGPWPPAWALPPLFAHHHYLLHHKRCAGTQAASPRSVHPAQPPLGTGGLYLGDRVEGRKHLRVWPQLIRQGVPGSLGAQTVKNPLAVQETRVRRIHWSRKWLLTLVFLPGEFHGQRSLAGYSPQELRVGHD